jgi:hypothetical protein
VGLLPFLAALALVAASAAASLNRFLTVTSALTVAVSLPFVGQQIVLYGALFGLPILASVFAAGRGAWPSLVVRLAAFSARCPGSALPMPYAGTTPCAIWGDGHLHT